jgi:hypothetical protein
VSQVRVLLGPPSCIIRKTFQNVFILPPKRPTSLTEVDQQKDIYRNPVALAVEWQETLSKGKYETRTALARDVGVHLSSVSRTLKLLSPDPDVLNGVLLLGDPLPGQIITVDRLVRLADFSPQEQKKALKQYLRSKGITILNL